MCGIVGAFGKENASELVLRGLERLEYRGYDSCGIAYLEDRIKVAKTTERVKTLKDSVKSNSIMSFGHTRWATHGKVTLENAHPHFSFDEKMYMVHNGVIENFKELKEELKGELKSETDTEIICNILNDLYIETNDIKEAVRLFINKVQGSYACIVYHQDLSDKVIAIRNKSPLVVGKKDNYFTISSDPIAVIEYVSDYMQLENKEFAIIDITNSTIEKFDQDLNNMNVSFEEIIMEDFNLKQTKEYDHFMLKEIEEQPLVIENIVNNYKDMTIDENLINKLKETSKIYIVASGTSFYAGMASKKMIEDSLKIPVECVIGSEFGYDNNLIEENSLFIFLSQSGETADSMVVFNQVKGKYPIVAITNVLGSQMDRNADYNLNLYAGVEVAVASTKAYIAQVTVLNILMAKVINDATIYDELLKVANDQKNLIDKQEEIKIIANLVAEYKQAFYIGRLRDYETSLEAALKVKEVTYININAYAAGELKHGPISLIDVDKLTLAIISNEKMSDATRSNIEEIRARDGKVLIFSTNKTQKTGDDFVVECNFENEHLLPLLTILPHQFIAYYAALALNLDVDKPRNLAKSVTVE